MTSLQGKVALVTGGGQGLGACICEMLAESGAIAIIADIQFNNAEKLAKEFHEKGLEALALPLDVTSEDQIKMAVEEVINRYGKLDILINNAGTDVTLPIEELTIADIDRVLDVNLRGPFILSQAVLPIMKQQGGGQIVNISSTASKRAWANATTYHASKWGLMGLNHALHVEARLHNIKVTAVVAGGMRTPFILERFPDTPLENLQDPRNVAATVRFVLMQPGDTVIPEIMVLPLRETSWP
jgi:NAD(P)-dependent dehydrogenase (short-subunit alcohol dehydrogenase family)